MVKIQFNRTSTSLATENKSTQSANFNKDVLKKLGRVLFVHSAARSIPPPIAASTNAGFFKTALCCGRWNKNSGLGTFFRYTGQLPSDRGRVQNLLLWVTDILGACLVVISTVLQGAKTSVLQKPKRPYWKIEPMTLHDSADVYRNVLSSPIKQPNKWIPVLYLAVPQISQLQL